MVSINKMDKLSAWITRLILLCCIISSSFACDRCSEYSSIRFQSSDKGEIILFIINVVLTKIGKILDKGYKCPVYCDVDHKHNYWEVYEEKTNRKENNLQAIARIHRAIRITSKE
jgi:hypothetical protein